MSLGYSIPEYAPEPDPREGTPFEQHQQLLDQQVASMYKPPPKGELLSTQYVPMFAGQLGSVVAARILGGCGPVDAEQASAIHKLVASICSTVATDGKVEATGVVLQWSGMMSFVTGALAQMRAAQVRELEQLRHEMDDLRAELAELRATTKAKRSTNTNTKNPNEGTPT